MSERVYTPWHVWIVGAVTLIWNMGGVVDYVLTKTKNEGYMSSFTPEQVEYFYNIPLIYTIFWALGVWGSLIGSVFILLRMKLSQTLFLISLIGYLGSLAYSLFLYRMPGMEVGHYIFSAVIFIVIVLTLWYARAMTVRGVLR